MVVVTANSCALCDMAGTVLLNTRLPNPIWSAAISGKAAVDHLFIHPLRFYNRTAHSFPTSHYSLNFNTVIMGYVFYSITFLFLVSATGTPTQYSLPPLFSH